MVTRAIGLVLLGMGLAGCMVQAGVGAAPSATAQPIINGSACDEMTDESAVGILVEGTFVMGNYTTPMRTLVCTGTLIAPDTVLTAGHCTDSALLTQGFGEFRDPVYWVTGQADLTALADQTAQTPAPLPADAVRVRAAVKNPGFNIQSFNTTVNGPGDFKDIALMFLEGSLPRLPMHVVTAEEATGLVTVGAAVTVVGWGQQTPAAANPMQPPPPGTVGRKICADSFINEVGSHEMQIGAGSETARKCHGDSGGPSYAALPGGGMRVVGVTSHAYDQTDCAKGGVDTRVDVWRDWLDGEMMTRCLDGTRTWCTVQGLPPWNFVFTRQADGTITAELDAGPPPDPGSGGDSNDDNKGGIPRPPGCSQAGGAGLWALLCAVLALRGLRQRR